MRRRSHLTPVVAALVLAIGCAGGVTGLRPIPPTANPSEQIDPLAAEISSAQERDVDILAPSWFGRARASLEAASHALPAPEHHETVGVTAAVVKRIVRRLARRSLLSEQPQPAEDLRRLFRLDVPECRLCGGGRLVAAM